MDKTPRHGDANIADVLRQLSVPAQEILLQTLQSHGNLGRVRLACRALHEFTDGTVTEVKLCLGPRHQELWQAGSRPPVLPRLRVLKLWLRHEASWDGSATSNLLQSIVRGFPAAVQGGITSLHVEGIDYGYPSPYATLSSVIDCLPALKDVNVGSWNQFPGESEQLALLYDKLARLPRLESLTAPTASVVEHLLSSSGGAFATHTLKRLHTDGGSFSLSAASAAAIQSLQQLTHLRMTNDLADVRQLLAALPPRLEELVQPSFALTLSSGTITAVRIELNSSLADLAGAWAEPLLGCTAMPRRLARLSIGTVNVLAEADDEELPEAAQTLLGRCQEVTTDTMLIESEVTDDAIQTALQALGRWPGGFLFNYQTSFADIQFCRLALPWGGTPFMRPLETEPTEPPPPPPGTLAERLRARIQALWAAPLVPYDPAAEEAVQHDNALSGAEPDGRDDGSGISRSTAAPGSSAMATLESGVGPVLLLRGPHLAELASSPGAVDEWLTGLWPEVVEAVKRPGPGGVADPELAEWPLEGAFLQLPTGDGDVLACFSHPKLAVAFAGLATAVPGICSADDHTASASGVHTAAAAPAVRALLGKEAAYGATSSEAQTIGDLLCLVMEPVLQQLWDERCCGAIAAADALAEAAADADGSGPEQDETLSRAGLLQLREILDLILGMQQLAEGEKQLDEGY